MNNIDTSQIVDPSKQQPFLGGSLAFLQSGNKELIRAICRSIMGEANYILSNSRVVIISGCNFNGTLNTIFEGAMFYQDEAYYFAGATGLSTYVNAPVIFTDYISVSPDPIQFTDGTTGNVHLQRRLKVIDAVSGSGLCDLKNAIYVSQNNGTKISIAAFSTSSSSYVGITGATYTTPKSITGLQRKYKIKMFGIASGPHGNVIDGVNLQIQNNTAGTSLKFASVGIANTSTSQSALTGATFYYSIYIEFSGLLDGNTQINGLMSTGGGLNSVTQFQFIVEEINQ